MSSTFVMISVAGPNRNHAKGTRGQPYWDEHAAFIDALVATGFILMGGPFEDEGGAMLIVRAGDADDVLETMRHDPWFTHGILQLQSVKRWDIFIDERG